MARGPDSGNMRGFNAGHRLPVYETVTTGPDTRLPNIAERTPPEPDADTAARVVQRQVERIVK